MEMTIVPAKPEQYDDGDTKPIFMYQETDTEFGIAREYFIERRRNRHVVDFQITHGRDDWHPASFNPEVTLRTEQQQCLDTVVAKFGAGHHGGMIRAVPGWGKTVLGCALIAKLNVPTLVIVHKEFLMNQWYERITGTGDDDTPAFIPEAKVGLCQQDVCDFRGKTVVLAMVHSVAARRYHEDFYDWPGLVIVDECHRMGAYTWSPVPARFACRYRVGLSATSRRKDGADNVF